MKKSSHGYIPVAGFMEKQLASMPEFHRSEMPEFTIHEYDPLIDSSDMTPADWQQIADDIRDNYDKYDGLCYSARHRYHGVYRVSAIIYARKPG